jgi:hypothetical protein
VKPETVKALEDNYRNQLGLIVICRHCRRTKSREEGHWDRVEEFLRVRPRHVSDGICSDCLQMHYPEQ